MPLYNSNSNDQVNISNNTVSETLIAQTPTTPAETAEVAEPVVAERAIKGNVLHKQIGGVDYLFYPSDNSRTAVEALKRGDLSNCAVERVNLYGTNVGKKWALNLSNSDCTPHTARGFEGVLVPNIFREGFDDNLTRQGSKIEIIGDRSFIRGNPTKYN